MWRRSSRRLTAVAGAAACAAVLAATPAGAADADWVQAALADQYDLGSDIGFRDAPFVGTHNSFNSVAEMGITLSDNDPNQKLTLVDQLDAGIRGLELDVHYVINPSTLSYQPVVCHARGEDQAHFGCTVEKTLGPVLDEVGGWLRAPAHSDQVILLYLEDHLGADAGHNAAAAILESKLGDLIYRPAGPGCTQLPLDVSRDDVRSAGKQVVIVGGCGVGTAYQGLVHSWDEHVEETPHGYTDFPECGTQFSRAQYDSTLVRYYEDSTRLSETVDGPGEPISPATAAQMARCGVDLLGMDQLTGASDPRLRALVWSWAQGEPRAGRRRNCAVQRIRLQDAGVFWRARPCDVKRRRVACRSRSGAWRIVAAKRGLASQRKACRRSGRRLAAPRTGYEAQLLREAMISARIRNVGIGYARRGGEWTALDNR